MSTSVSLRRTRVRPAAAGPSTRATEAEQAATRVLRQFRVIFSAVRSHFRQVEQTAGIGGAQVWALSVIRGQPGLGVGELAQVLSVRQPTASILVKGLVQQGLVEARREGADRRAVQLHLLPDGRKLLRKAPAPHAGVLPEALVSLDADTLARIERDLSAVIARLGADGSAAGTPLADL